MSCRRKATALEVKKVCTAILLCAITLHSLNAAAQTNCPPNPSRLFSVPTVALRAPLISRLVVPSVSSDLPTVQVSNSQTVPRTGTLLDISHDASNNAVSGEITANRFNSDFDQRLFWRLEKGGYLTQHAPGSDNRLDRVLDGIFQPEIIHVGKTTVSCSLLTAITRKNPLCLINPIFFQLCW